MGIRWQDLTPEEKREWLSLTSGDALYSFESDIRQLEDANERKVRWSTFIIPWLSIGVAVDYIKFDRRVRDHIRRIRDFYERVMDNPVHRASFGRDHPSPGEYPNWERLTSLRERASRARRQGEKMPWS